MGACVPALQFVVVDGDKSQWIESTMLSDAVTKCSHPPCKCNVEVEEPFCSEFCADETDRLRTPCQCGHPECVGPEEAVDVEEPDDVPAA